MNCKILGNLMSAKHYQLGPKETETVWREIRQLDIQTYIDRKQTDETTQLKIHAILHEKGKMIQRPELKTTDDYFQPLKSWSFQVSNPWIMEYVQLNLKILLFFFPVLPFEWEYHNCYLTLFHHCLLGADNLILGFRSP